MFIWAWSTSWYKDTMTQWCKKWWCKEIVMQENRDARKSWCEKIMMRENRDAEKILMRRKSWCKNRNGKSLLTAQGAHPSGEIKINVCFFFSFLWSVNGSPVFFTSWTLGSSVYCFTSGTLGSHVLDSREHHASFLLATVIYFHNKGISWPSLPSKY